MRTFALMVATVSCATSVPSGKVVGAKVSGMNRQMMDACMVHPYSFPLHTLSLHLR